MTRPSPQEAAQGGGEEIRQSAASDGFGGSGGVSEALSSGAERYAICTWKLIPRTSITATWPERMSPCRRILLDELTNAGLLSREDDVRGPMTWKPTEPMHAFVRDRPIPADLL